MHDQQTTLYPETKTRRLWEWVLLALIAAAVSPVSLAQSQKPLLLRDPAVSKSQVAFSYAGSIWVANRDGSNVHRLTTGGHEARPSFSPDGSLIAFTGDYDGTHGVYVVPAAGGEPRRLTYHPADADVQGWTPDGKRILFSSLRTAFAGGVIQLFTVSLEGGFATQVPLVRAAEGSFSPDGARIAYVPNLQWQRAWKRYRGCSARPASVRWWASARGADWWDITPILVTCWMAALPERPTWPSTTQMELGTWKTMACRPISRRSWILRPRVPDATHNWKGPWRW